MAGITRGLQLIADWVRLLILAVAQGNTEAVVDVSRVGSVWYGETTDEAGKVRVSGWSLLIGADPWKGSRAQLREVSEKWRDRL